MISSLDILYLVIAFAVLWVAGFICWFIFQIVIVMKEIHKTVHALTYALENVEKSLNGIKSKFGPGKLHEHLKDSFASWKKK